jgi:hypothetical protein
MPKILLFRQDGPEAPQLQKWLRLRLLSLQYRYGWDMNVNAYIGSEKVVTWKMVDIKLNLCFGNHLLGR